jgi:predicted acylesterase/phospholipase RssA
VIRAFLDEGLLPRVITGTSAGGLVAALTCTRTDEELKVLLTPKLADKITACEEPFLVWFSRFMETGARFDSSAYGHSLWFMNSTEVLIQMGKKGTSVCPQEESGLINLRVLFSLAVP